MNESTNPSTVQSPGSINSFTERHPELDRDTALAEYTAELAEYKSVVDPRFRNGAGAVIDLSLR